MVVRKEKDKYVLYSADGTKILGTHDSKSAAAKQEQAIQIQKRRKLRGETKKGPKR